MAAVGEKTIPKREKGNNLTEGVTTEVTGAMKNCSYLKLQEKRGRGDSRGGEKGPRILPKENEGNQTTKEEGRRMRAGEIWFVRGGEKICDLKKKKKKKRETRLWKVRDALFIDSLGDGVASTLQERIMSMLNNARKSLKE